MLTTTISANGIFRLPLASKFKVGQRVYFSLLWPSKGGFVLSAKPVRAHMGRLMSCKVRRSAKSLNSRRP